MARTIRILGIHGLGDHRNLTWEKAWEDAVRSAFPGLDDGITLEFRFVNYDPIFEQTDISGWEAARAFWKLTRSGVGGIFRRRGVLGDVAEKIKWTAGYVVAWVEDTAFQEATRRLLLDEVTAFKPDFVLAHSLGSLVTYNAFSHPDARSAPVRDALSRIQFVSLGSQIGNPFVVRNLTPGRIEPLPVKFWYHLYNSEDDVFTAPIRLPEMDDFLQVHTRFDIQGFADHAATAYLTHGNTRSEVWLPAAERRLNARAFGPKRRSRRRTVRVDPADRPDHRALIVGINSYPNPEDRLEGCVNDAFLMSSVLQECGFAADNIRLCLNERATAAGIIERLDWLLDDPRPGDERVFYYSGHGATVPEYGVNNEPDRLMETLVPYDFDWTPETAIGDEQIFGLYAQLPYDTRLALIFDCCHSGGMHRDGLTRARAITAPDDVRHRSLKWDLETRMWVPRDFERMNEAFSRSEDVNAKFFGRSGHLSRLGRASMLRGMSERDYRAETRRAKGPVGPYLPLIIEACGEAQLAYEYRHGAMSYGAFTYALAQLLRHYQRITFDRLVEATGERLADLGYEQQPRILGPGAVTGSLVPWL